MVTGPIVIACYREPIDLIIAGFHPKSDLLVKSDRALVYRRSARPDNPAVLVAADFKKVFIDGFAQPFVAEIRMDSHKMDIGFVFKGRGHKADQETDHLPPFFDHKGCIVKVV